MVVKYDPILGELREADTTASSDLTSDEVAAIQAANDPDESNPFATTDDLPSEVVVFDSGSGTSHTFAAADNGKYITLSNAGAITLTLPLNATVELPVGFSCTVEQGGEGVITATAAENVTLTGDPVSGGQYKVLFCVKKATDTWNVIGGTTA